ncbi:hypothetical protein QMT40_002097 [Parvibaculaceae bacterium PLY_AMNH_Bact1]|nr:hypothetical protein QMT40_002097 [Parvibaculaceae bacterium PLY_AMNH_Bact1]
MKRFFFVLIAPLFLFSCGSCRDGNCYFEVPFTFGGQFLTEERVSREVRYQSGMIDQFARTPNHDQIDFNHFEVEALGFDGFEALQRKPEWCWAAAVSMVLNYQGIPFSQCKVLQSLGEDCNSEELQFGSVNSIITSLRGIQVNRARRPAFVHATSLATGNGTPLVEDVATNWPPIVGLGARGDQAGHVYVLTRVEYSWMPGAWNVPVIWRVRLYDPWDGRYVSMSGSEFDDLFDFAVRVRVQHG